MKKIMKIITITLLILCLNLCTACSCFGCSDCGDDTTDNFPNMALNQNTTLDREAHLHISPKYEFTKDASGYYLTDCLIEVTISGYSQLSYFNCVVNVTFSATTITDSAPSGTNLTQQFTINLSNNGEGHESHTISLVNCRHVNQISFSYSTQGTVTKISES